METFNAVLYVFVIVMTTNILLRMLYDFKSMAMLY